MVVWTILMDIGVPMTMMIARFSRPLMVAISLYSLRTSMVVAYTRVSIAWFSRPLVISSIATITSSKSLGGSVDIAVTSISIARFS